MFNFDEPRYEKVVSDALALRPQIEAAVDKVCEQGYSNIFFIGCERSTVMPSLRNKSEASFFILPSSITPRDVFG